MHTKLLFQSTIAFVVTVMVGSALAMSGGAFGGANVVQIARRTETLQVPVEQVEKKVPVPTVEGLGVTASDARIGMRLQNRIRNRLGISLSLKTVVAGMTEQRALLSKTMTVTFATDDGKKIPDLVISADHFPLLLAVNVTRSGMRTAFDTSGLQNEVLKTPPEGIILPVDAVLTAKHDEYSVEKATTDGIAKSGYDFDAAASAQTIVDAFEHGDAALSIPIHTVAGRIANTTGEDLGALTLIATGRSNFKGSGEGRKANVRKGLTQHLHNTIVPSGKQFSMNSVISHVPVSQWSMALGIFDGGTLRMVPGGGLCQVATTLYRAALDAGFPILKRANHSLFVHYYEAYGVGIDATIFPGQQDLTFMNNTNGALLIQAYVDGDEATVNIYGTPDGRTTALEGPYFSKNAPAGLFTDGRTLHNNEIAWEQHITFPDGHTEANTILSRYKSIPTSVVTKYLHAAAENNPSITD